MADDDDEGSFFAVLLGEKGAAQCGADTESGKQIGGDKFSLERRKGFDMVRFMRQAPNAAMETNARDWEDQS